MAKKQAPGKKSPAPKQAKQTKQTKQPKAASVSTLRGLRRAEAVQKQVARWIERKWPMITNASEWLQFAHALEGYAHVLKADALSHVNPSLLVKSKAELARERADRIIEARRAQAACEKDVGDDEPAAEDAE